MKFTFEKLGPIREATLELGDLTVIAGRNNTGKSYIAYAIYGFFRDFGKLANTERDRWPDTDSVSPRTKLTKHHIIDQLLDGNQVEVKTTKDDLDSDRIDLVRHLASVYCLSRLDDLFNATTGTFEQSVIDVETDKNPFEYIPHTLVHNPECEFTIKHDANTNTLQFTLDQDGNTDSDDSPKPSIRQTLERYLPYMYSRFLLQSNFLSDVEVRCFTSVRLAISLFHKELESSRRLAVRRMQQDERTMKDDEGTLWVPADEVSGASRYVLPINDEIDFVKNIPDDDHSPKENSRQSELDDIEKMMEGHYEKHKDEFYFVFSDRRGGRIRIPLHLASSSVAELSNLYFHFRNSNGHHNQILIIDEPESHLDTANQIQLARLLARLVNSGVKVLITTHSDYIVKEINNLVMLNSSFAGKEGIVERFKYKEDEKLSPDSIEAYVAEKGTLTHCLPDQFGIDMPVFDKTINEINEASDNLFALLKEVEEG